MLMHSNQRAPAVMACTLLPQPLGSVTTLHTSRKPHCHNQWTTHFSYALNHHHLPQMNSSSTAAVRHSCLALGCSAILRHTWPPRRCAEMRTPTATVAYWMPTSLSSVVRQLLRPLPRRLQLPIIRVFQVENALTLLRAFAARAITRLEPQMNIIALRAVRFQAHLAMHTLAVHMYMKWRLQRHWTVNQCVMIVHNMWWLDNAL